MNPDPDPLEKLIHQSLRSLPPLQAPAALELRVLAEIARRESVATRQRSWSSWSAPFRWGVIILSLLACGLMVAAAAIFFDHGSWVTLRAFFGGPLQQIMTLVNALQGIAQATSNLVGLLPRTWLYIAVLGVFGVYGLMFGIGATAYRTLWKTR